MENYEPCTFYVHQYQSIKLRKRPQLAQKYAMYIRTNWTKYTLYKRSGAIETPVKNWPRITVNQFLLNKKIILIYLGETEFEKMHTKIHPNNEKNSLQRYTRHVMRATITNFMLGPTFNARAQYSKIQCVTCATFHTFKITRFTDILNGPTILANFVIHLAFSSV